MKPTKTKTPYLRYLINIGQLYLWAVAIVLLYIPYGLKWLYTTYSGFHDTPIQ